MTGRRYYTNIVSINGDTCRDADLNQSNQYVEYATPEQLALQTRIDSAAEKNRAEFPDSFAGRLAIYAATKKATTTMEPTAHQPYVVDDVPTYEDKLWSAFAGADARDASRELAGQLTSLELAELGTFAAAKQVEYVPNK